jgi:hypothetical protein
MSRPHVDLTERVAALRVWAEERIRICRRIETESWHSAGDLNAAALQRVMLTDVLRRLGYPVPPREESPKEPR